MNKYLDYYIGALHREAALLESHADALQDALQRIMGLNDALRTSASADIRYSMERLEKIKLRLTEIAATLHGLGIVAETPLDTGL